MPSSIDFSAQFGGADAAQAVLPHFRTLKRAAAETRIAAFPFPKLAFILRVDGSVNTYDLHGAGNIDIHRRGEYVSVDIGITRDDRDALAASGYGRSPHGNVITEALQGSVPLLVNAQDKRLRGIYAHALAGAIRELCEKYETYLGDLKP